MQYSYQKLDEQISQVQLCLFVKKIVEISLLS